MPDAKLLDNLRILAYLGIVLWFGALAMFFLSELKKCPEFNGKDKLLRSTKNTLIRSRGYIVFISALILISFLIRHFHMSIISVALLVCFLLPAYFISIYTKRFLEKGLENDSK